MRRLVFCVLVSPSGVLPAWAQSAASQYAGRPIEDVRLLVENKPTTDAAFVDLIEVRIGEALSPGGGARIDRPPLQPRPLPGRPGRGRPRRPAAALRSASTSSRSTAFSGSSSRARWGCPRGCCAAPSSSATAPRRRSARVDAAVRTLQQLYADHGYLRAKVEASTEVQHAPERSLLTFTVDAGPRAVIGQVAIERDPLVSREEFLRQLGAAPGEVFLRPRIQERLDAYVRRLKDRRYYEADGSLQAVASEDGRSVDLGDRHHVWPAGDRALRFSRGRRHAGGSPQGAGAARARGIGRRRPARGLRNANRELPPAAGLLEGRRHRPPGGHGRGAHDRVQRESRAAVSRGAVPPRSPARRRCRRASWRRSSRSSRASSSSSPSSPPA